MQVLRGLIVFVVAAAIACGPNQAKPHDSSNSPDLGALVLCDTCDVDQDGYTIRMGDCNDFDPATHPGAAEVCYDHKDQDCDGVADQTCDDDGDGWALKAGKNGKGVDVPGGDCDDNDPFINPGAYEVLANGRDDDCDSHTDNPYPPCDGTLPANDAMSFPRSMDLCPPWLQSAQWNAHVDPNAHSILTNFGSFYKPQSGANFVLLSTGIAVDEKSNRWVAPEPGTQFQSMEPNPAGMPGIASHNVCTGSGARTGPRTNDLVALTVTIKVPTNAKGFTFKSNFFTSEYPEFVGGFYNDMYYVLLDSKKFQGNIAFDMNGDAINVNNAFLTVCKDEPICGGIMNPKVQGHRCTPNSLAQLLGTGYELPDNTGQPYGGATGWLATTAPVTFGETITLTFVIYDDFDHMNDSSVLLDGFQWLFDDTILQTNPIG